MTSLMSAVAASFDDRINPILVKETRQATQSRFVAWVMLLFLLIMVIIIGFSVLALPDALDQAQGADLFNVLHGCLLIVTVLFAPVYTGVRTAAERSDHDVDLFFITTLKPFSVIWGKFITGTTLAALIYFTCMPFLTLCTMLRGIDIPTIAFVLSIDLMIITGGIMAAILIACLGTSQLMKLLLGLCLTIGMFIMSGIWIGASATTISYGGGFDFQSPEFLTGMGVATSIWVAAMGLMALLANACIMPPSADRLGPVRMFLVGVWVLTLIAFVTAQHYGVPEAIEMWVYGWGLVIAGLIVIAISERQDLGPRIQRIVPRTPLLRPLRFLFCSGASSGMIWLVLLGAATVLIGSHLDSFSSMAGVTGDISMSVYATIFLLLYAYCYCMTAALFRWTWTGRFIPERIPIGVDAGVLTAVGIIVPWMIILYALVHDSQQDMTVGMVFNPTFSFILAEALVSTRPHYDFRVVDGDFAWNMLRGMVVFAVVLTAVMIPWHARQMRQFRPLQPRQALANFEDDLDESVPRPVPIDPTALGVVPPPAPTAEPPPVERTDP